MLAAVELPPVSIAELEALSAKRIADRPRRFPRSHRWQVPAVLIAAAAAALLTISIRPVPHRHPAAVSSAPVNTSPAFEEIPGADSQELFPEITSDSTDDGTQVFLQGLIPTSANTGGTTTIGSYSSPNKIYGTWKPAASAAIIEPTELVLNGLGANYSFTGGFANLPLFQIFGFTDGRGQPSDPGGYFDLLAYVATGATTGGACNIYARVDYSL